MTRAREIEEEKMRFRESSMQESVKIAFRAYTLRLRSDRDRDVEKDREKGRERRLSGKNGEHWRDSDDRGQGDEKGVKIGIGENSRSSAVDISLHNGTDRVMKRREEGGENDENEHDYYDQYNGSQERMTDSISNSADNDSHANTPHKDDAQSDLGPQSRYLNNRFEIDWNHGVSNNSTAKAILEVICCKSRSDFLNMLTLVFVSTVYYFSCILLVIFLVWFSF